MTRSKQAVREVLSDGPATSREIADRSGLSILTVRSRIAELLISGDVRRIGNQRDENYTYGRPFNIYALKRVGDSGNPLSVQRGRV